MLPDLFNVGFLGVGGITIQAFAELGRTTLGSGQSTITVTGLPNKKWLIVLVSLLGQVSAGDLIFNFGNGSVDSGSNYAYRFNDGTGETTQTSKTFGDIGAGALSTTVPKFTVLLVENASATNEKTAQGLLINQNTAGAANSPGKSKGVFKWTDTTNPIERIQVSLGSGSNMNTGSEVVIIGADPNDSGVTPFFKELARVTTSSGTTLTTSTFTAKKYMYFTDYMNVDGGGTRTLRVGNTTIDTGSNYAYRRSYNGGADSTGASASTLDDLVFDSVSAGVEFRYGFGINVASQEKLFVGHVVYGSNDGAGNAPRRNEFCGKWTNISNQFNIIGIDDSASFVGSSELVVYGEN